MKYFHFFMAEATQNKRVVEVRTKDTTTDMTANYIDEMTPEHSTIKYISGVGAGELECCAKFQRMLADRGINTVLTSLQAPKQ